jgi:catalase
LLSDLHVLLHRPQGSRVVHARGMMLSGHFTPAPVAARMTRAAHMQGHPVRVLARFSGGAGWPWWPDFLPDVRGLAVAFFLPDGQRTDLVAASLPRFPVATPQALHELLVALRPRFSLAWRLPWCLLRHPEVVLSLPANLVALLRLPASYAGVLYYALHTFTWITPYGSERHVRYRWVPEQRRSLSWWRALWRGPRYLGKEMRSRLRRGAVRLHLQVQVARRGDALGDPSRPWPAAREVVTVGTLELVEEVGGRADIAFDPLRLVEGVQAPHDPVLLARHDVYRAAARERQAPPAAVEAAGNGDAAAWAQDAARTGGRERTDSLAPRG